MLRFRTSMVARRRGFITVCSGSTARGVAGFGPKGLLSLMIDMRLPKFGFDGDDRYQFSWPPPAVAGGRVRGAAGWCIWPCWHEKLAERDRQIVAEVKRADAQAQARQREREKPEREEIRKAK